jgi:hypothetical protein
LGDVDDKSSTMESMSKGRSHQWTAVRLRVDWLEECYCEGHGRRVGGDLCSTPLLTQQVAERTCTASKWPCGVVRAVCLVSGGRIARVVPLLTADTRRGSGRSMGALPDGGLVVRQRAAGQGYARCNSIRGAITIRGATTAGDRLRTARWHSANFGATYMALTALGEVAVQCRAS